MAKKNSKLALELFGDLMSEDDRRLAHKKAMKLVPSRVYEESSSGVLMPSSELLSMPDDFDIQALMDSAEDPVTGTLRDLKIDDRDLPLAKNYYDFCFNILGKDTNPPWSRQFFTIAKLFGEICPTCSNPKWKNPEDVPKDFDTKDMPEHLQFLDNGVCPKCKTEKREFIRNRLINPYNEGVICWGQRSGKSETGATAASYLTHRFLKFPKLSSLTKALQASTPLTGTFVSLTFTKAVSLLWTPFMNKLNSSTWYKEYHAMLDHYGNKYGEELYRKKDLFIKYFHKGLHLYPSHPQAGILRGDTRFLGEIDELGLFPLPDGNDEEDEQSARTNADEAHKSLTNSLLTVQSAAEALLKQGYNSVPTGLMLGVSSPMSERDKVMRLLKDSKTENGSRFILGSQLSTWEVNPYIERDSPIIVLAYERNASKAERDYGANPPRVQAQYITQAQVATGVFVGNKNSHIVNHKFDSPGETYGTLQANGVTFKHPSILSIDAGEVDNGFAITSTHYDFITGKTVVDTAIEVTPTDGRRINFNLVYKHIILPLAIQSHAILVLADRWNSLDLLHRIKEDGGKKPDGKPKIASKQYSVKRADFDIVLALLNNKNLILPYINKEDQNLVLVKGVENFKVDLLNKPVAHLMHQMITVRDMNPAKPPIKGDGATDDLFRALVLGASKIHEPKVMEALQAAYKTMALNPDARVNPLPVFLGRSS